jgi:hypothetical protein
MEGNPLCFFSFVFFFLLHWGFELGASHLLGTA